jgi:hypothetical protein
MSTVAWSQSTPTTQQSETDRRAPFRATNERGFEGRAFGGGAGDGMRPPRTEWRRGDRPDYQQPQQEPTAEEWKEIEAFMKSHSPKRWERVNEIADEQRQQTVRNMFANRYRAMQELKENDPELHKIRLERMPIEDEVFALGWDLSHSKADKPDEVRGELRKQVRLLLKSGLRERAHRLKQAKKRLAQDEEKLESAVDANMADIADERWPRILRPPQQRRDRRPEDGSGNDINAAPIADP